MSLTDLLDNAFFAQHWRRSPVLLRGGVDHVLPRGLSSATIDSWVLAATGPGDSPVLRRDGEVQFLEGIRDPAVAEALTAAEALFGTPAVWFDVVRTTGLGTIGAHVDDSDNFVVHLDGVKQWWLARPERVPPQQWRRRMLGDASAGVVAIHEPDWECVARPGDVVYLPLGWPHLGIARTPSTSTSLVVQAESRAQAIARAVFDELAATEWGTEAVEVGPDAPAVATNGAQLRAIIEGFRRRAE